LDTGRLAGSSSGPAALLLAHGAGSGPSIFDGWETTFPRLRVRAVDLQARLDVARASMDDYAAQVRAAAAELPLPLVLCGRSMGGLVAMLAARRLDPPPHSMILIEPSPPAEVQRLRLEIDAGCTAGTFDPEAVYGPFPTGLRARPESSLARAERKRGIPIPCLPCRTLVVYGDEFPDDRGRRIAQHYGTEERAFAGLDHWGLIRDRRVREAIGAFLGVATGNKTRRSIWRA
jgi:pimeloyl-ACP methyl ester carboxylesterase